MILGGEGKEEERDLRYAIRKSHQDVGSKSETEATNDFQLLAHTHRLTEPCTDREKRGRTPVGEKSKMSMVHLCEF